MIVRPFVETGCIGAIEDAVAVYGDGGCILSNPSPIGGTWAWCAVDGLGNRVAWASGVEPVGGVWGAGVTNNQMEFAALMYALAALPDGWTGNVYSDSQNALGRMFKQWALRGIPGDLSARAAADRRRLARLRPIQLDGHPTRAQLAAGVGKRGNPVSAFNVWCDKACTEIGRRYLLALTADDSESAA